MFFYFRKIHVHGIKNIPKDKPVLLLSNHQNALLDALLIATKCGRFSYFLTRAGVFKKSFVSKILNSLQMLPIYRVRDGWGNLSNNNAVFKTCSELLYKKEAIVIFPEGSHNLKRTVRPLSKGFTRIVFETIEKYPELDLQLVPVGVNFMDAKSFPDSASLFFEKPICAIDFISGNKNKDVIKLKDKIQSEISNITTHIPTENYNNTLNILDNLNINYLNPIAVNKCISNNFKNCKGAKKAKLKGLRLFFKGLLVLNIFLPYLFWKFIVKPKVKEVEFTSTFRFAIAITLVPAYLIVVTLILMSLLSFQFALIYLLSVIIISLITVKL